MFDSDLKNVGALLDFTIDPDTKVQDEKEKEVQLNHMDTINQAAHKLWNKINPKKEVSNNKIIKLENFEENEKKMQKL